jgi:hypothetical protein
LKTSGDKRVFGNDISVCTLCGDTLHMAADVTDPDGFLTILAHLKQQRPLMLCTDKDRDKDR